MSCYVVDRDLIDLLVTDITGAGPWTAHRGDLLRPNDTPPYGVSIPDYIGRMLWLENLASVEHRYPDTAESGRDYPGPVDFDRETALTYMFRIVVGAVPDAWLINAVTCYQYQACEHPGWSTSRARELTDAVLQTAASRIARQAGAPWGFTREALRLNDGSLPF